MSDRGILIFAYDGSFNGFLSVVFDSFSLKTIPADIVVFDDDVSVSYVFVDGRSVL